jgi:hypothetical protein
LAHLSGYSFYLSFPLTFINSDYHWTNLYSLSLNRSISLHSPRLGRGRMFSKWQRHYHVGLREKWLWVSFFCFERQLCSAMLLARASAVQFLLKLEC